MLVGSMFMGKKYGLVEYMAMSSLTIGMIIFSVGDAIVRASFPLRGVAFVLLALVADAFIGNVQVQIVGKVSWFGK